MDVFLVYFVIYEWIAIIDMNFKHSCLRLLSLSISISSRSNIYIVNSNNFFLFMQFSCFDEKRIKTFVWVWNGMREKIGCVSVMWCLVDLGWTVMSQLSQLSQIQHKYTTRFKCSTNHKWLGILQFGYNIPTSPINFYLKVVEISYSSI